MQNPKTTLAAIAALCAAPALASAATFDFTSEPNGGVEVLTKSDGGVTVDVTAGAYVADGALFFDTDVDGVSVPNGVPIIGGTQLGDLVVATHAGSGGFFSTDAGIGVGLASIPTLGPDINGLIDLLTFTFDQVVDFASVTFGNVDSGDDVDVFVDGVLVAPADADIPNNGIFDLSGLTGTSISFGADQLGFGRFGDNFNVRAMTVEPSAVPLPAGGVLILSALGGFAALRRRKQSA